MGQFKPMVKMMTTEPSVELKLKKGGKVEKKMQMGGSPDMAAPAMPSMPARGGMMGAKAPMKPSMAARRRAMRAMPSGAAPAAPVGMAAQVMKEGGETKSMHKAEMAKMAKTSKALKEHADKPASKAHKGLKTGGVVNGQGGFKAGGIINTENQGGEYRNTKMDTAKPDHSPAKTGDVKMGNAGGYATGGVAKANAGGYKKGGAAKKAYAAGGVVDSGAPVAMPQGRKKPSAPVSITELSGTFKKGGRVTAAEGRLQKAFTKENATAMKQAKAYSNEVYSKYQKKAGGGAITDKEREVVDLSNGAYDRHYANEKAENEAMREAILGAPKRAFDSIRGMFKGMGSVTNKEREILNKSQPSSVTKTEKSVTVTPAKKRGGRVC